MDLNSFPPLLWPPGRRSLVTVDIDFAQAAWNTVGAHRVFTVQGIVVVTMLFSIRTLLTSGGAATLAWGLTSSTARYSSAQAYTGYTANTMVRSAATAPTSAVSLINFDCLSGGGSDMIDGGLSGGNNIGATVAGAPLTGGTIQAYAWWTPISSDGSVVAAAGGAL